jgi:hypothetical protein
MHIYIERERERGESSQRALYIYIYIYIYIYMCVCVTLGLLVSLVSTSLVSTQLISTQLISTHESKTLYFLEESSNNCIFHQESWPTSAKHVLFPVETTTSAFRRTPLRGPSSRPQRNEVAIRLAISNFSDFLGRLQPLVATPEEPQILVTLCEKEAGGGVYILT